MKRELMEMCDTTTETPLPPPQKRSRLIQGLKTVKEEIHEQLEPIRSPMRQHLLTPKHSKRRALDRDFATKLASITLTSGDLIKLDAIFGGPDGDMEQLEQFSAAVSGCLVRFEKHMIGQERDVIAEIADLVSPMDTHQFFFPQRRIFVYHFGYFQFDQVAEQKPELVDYGPWIADMEIQCLPIPSDEFIIEKSKALKELLSNTKVERVNLEEQNEEQCSLSQNAEDDIQVLDLETASSTVKTEETDKRSEMTEDEIENNEEESSSDEDEKEAEEREKDEPPLDELVHTQKLLEKVLVPFNLVQLLSKYPELSDCLIGCLVIFFDKDEKKHIIDEVAQLNHQKIKLKHIQEPFPFSNLHYSKLTCASFNQWIDDMIRWGEALPSIAEYRKRRDAVFTARNKTKKIKRIRKMKKAEKQGTTPNTNMTTNPNTTTKKTQKQRNISAEDKAKNNMRAEFKNAFGKETLKIMIDPRHLVQLHQLGEIVFTKVVTGLLVRCSIFDQKIKMRRLSIEQIRTVTFKHPIYAMFGQSMTAQLHFINTKVNSIPIINVKFGNPDVEKQLLEQNDLINNFIPPSSDFISQKSQELLDALSKTKPLKGKSPMKDQSKPKG